MLNHITAVIILGLFTLFVAVQPAIAQTPKTTASEVVDAETLKAFVEGAKARLASMTDPTKILAFGNNMRSEGDWKHGNIYLAFLFPNGVVLFHGDDPELRGKNLSNVVDARGNMVVQNLISAAGEGGGHVEYYWDDPEQDGEMHITIPAEATSGSTILTFTVAGDARDEASGETIIVTATHDKEALASATITVTDK